MNVYFRPIPSPFARKTSLTRAVVRRSRHRTSHGRHSGGGFVSLGKEEPPKNRPDCRKGKSPTTRTPSDLLTPRMMRRRAAGVRLGRVVTPDFINPRLVAKHRDSWLNFAGPHSVELPVTKVLAFGGTSTKRSSFLPSRSDLRVRPGVTQIHYAQEPSQSPSRTADVPMPPRTACRGARVTGPRSILFGPSSTPESQARMPPSVARPDQCYWRD